MDKPISVGDLVMTVTPKHCCGKGRIGLVFLVADLRPPRNPMCTDCGNTDNFGIVAVQHGKKIFDLYRLKRIPPLSELEGEKRDEKLTEPA